MSEYSSARPRAARTSFEQRFDRVFVTQRGHDACRDATAVFERRLAHAGAERQADQSTFALENFTTRVHLSVSARMKAAN